MNKSDTSTTSQPTRLDGRWVLLQAVVATGIILTVILVMTVVADRIIPPLVVIAAVYLVGLGLIRIRPRIGAITIGVLATLQVISNVVNISQVIDGLTTPSLAGDFLVTIVFQVLPIAGIVGLIGTLRNIQGGVAIRVLAGAGVLLGVAAVAAVTAALATDSETVADPVATNTVLVDDNRFAPTAIEVETGTTVTWTWVGENTHDVVAEGLFQSNLQAEGSFTYSFSEPGKVSYVCTIHPGMKGTVTVVAADTSGSGP
ncbi:MAG: plastocyanin/azurin family copper-binding protein [Acidimicrobiia bacterium]